ncbi:endonuclease/exonuclease/phosphatase family protein [Streptomyces sp. NPDC002845]
MDTVAAAGRTGAGAGAGAEGRRGGRRAGVWVAGVLLVGVSVVVGYRAADSDGVTPVTQSLAFLPWLLAPTGFALLLAGLARWWAGLVWGVVVLGLLAWFIEPYGKVSEPGGPPVAEVRVMAANVELGQGTEALVEAIRRTKPDIVFVPECEYRCAGVLSEEFDGDAYAHRQSVEGYGSEGSVILSRFPLTAAEGVPGTMGMPGATADVKGHPVRLQLAHPYPPLPGQLDTWRSELGALRAYAEADTGTPTVLAGDFNASQDHAAFRRILDAGLTDGARLAGDARTPTWPARTAPTALGAQIDHVLVSRDFTAQRARFLDLENTDHRALLVDLTLHQRK